MDHAPDPRQFSPASAQHSPASTQRATKSTKRSLLALSHAMERSLDVGRDPGDDTRPSLIIGLFQRRRYFDVERDRYAALAAQGTTCVVAFAGSTEDLPDGVHGVALEPADPLAQEWSLVVLDGSLGTSLVALDLGDLIPGAETFESGRLFDARWSFGPADACDEADRLLGRLEDRLDPDAIARAVEAVALARRATMSLTERRLAAVTEVLVHGIETAHLRAESLAGAVRRERELAERDPLTGLGNRLHLRRFMESADPDSPTIVAAVLLDLDGLKAINDTFGHSAGDAAIVTVARVLGESTRAQDRLVRLGGDEFLVLLPGMDLVTAACVAERIVHRVAATRPPAPQDHLRLGVSAGVLSGPTRDLDLDRLDQALYQAKRAGKGCVAVV